MAAGEGSRATVGERLHPASWGVALFVLVNVGRLPELVPQLAALELGKVALLAAVAGVVLSRRKGPLTAFADPTGRRMLAFVGLAAASVSFSIWGSNSLKYLLNNILVIGAFFFILRRAVVGVREWRLVLGSLIAAALLLAVFTLRLNWDGRLAVGETYDPNDLALMLVTVLALLAARSFSSKGLMRAMLWGGAGAITFAVFLTESRGGLLALLAGIVYVVQASSSGRGHMGVGAKLLVVALLAAGLWAMAPESAKDRFATLLSLGSDYNVSDRSGRFDIWSRGIGIMLERPVGVGLNSFEVAEGQAGGTYMAAHNALLQVGAELGFLGLAIFLSLYAAAWRASSRALVRARASPRGARLVSEIVGVRGALVAFFVGSFFLSQAYAGLLYLLFALAAVSLTLPEQTEEPAEAEPAWPYRRMAGSSG